MCLISSKLLMTVLHRNYYRTVSDIK